MLGLLKIHENAFRVVSRLIRTSGDLSRLLKTNQGLLLPYYQDFERLIVTLLGLVKMLISLVKIVLRLLKTHWGSVEIPSILLLQLVKTRENTSKAPKTIWAILQFR